MTLSVRARGAGLVLAVLAFALAITGAAVAEEPQGNSNKVAIYLTIEPVDTTPGALRNPQDAAVTTIGKAVKISGVAARDLAGKTLAITITPPQKEEPWQPDPEGNCPSEDKPPKVIGMYRPDPPKTVTVEVGPNGQFETEFTPKVNGTHDVEAVDGGNAYRGVSKFEVIEGDLEPVCWEIPQEEIAQNTAELTKLVCEATDILAQRVLELPASPVRIEFKKQLDELAEKVREALPCGEAPEWVSGIYYVNQLRKLIPPPPKDPENKTPGKIDDPLVQPKDYIPRWKKETDKAKVQGRRALADLKHGNVVCDQLDIVVNGFKFIDFYIGLIIKPGAFLADWAKENIPTKLIGMVPPVKQTSALKEGIETAWKGVLTFKPHRSKGGIKIGAKSTELALGVTKMANAMSSYVANRVFESLCQTFQGPMSGTMEAEFVGDDGEIWWKYQVKIGGQLILRYPKDAKGDVIPLTGEFLGNATHLESSDNAVPVLFPELAQGTVFRTMRVEPIAMDTIPHLIEKHGGVKLPDYLPDTNPITSVIEQGGVITQGVMTPAFFRVPVRAELRDGKSLTLKLEPAARDFDDLRVKVIHIMLPVLSLWPDVIDYALPYKGAHFLMLRAMNDGPVDFEVKSVGKTMVIERKFDRAKPGKEAKGEYHLQIKACNPACQ